MAGPIYVGRVVGTSALVLIGWLIVSIITGSFTMIVGAFTVLAYIARLLLGGN